MLEQACYDLLRLDPVVASLSGGRIYMGHVPEGNNSWPVLVFHRVNTPRRELHLTGTAGLLQARIMVEVVGKRYVTVDTNVGVVELADAAIAVLDQVFHRTVAGTVIQHGTIEGPEDDLEQVGPGTDDRFHRRRFDWLAWYEEEPIAIQV